MTTFIRVTEVWVPSDDGLLLEFGGGIFGSALRFRSISRAMCFGRGEGLPGRAWEEGRPVMLKRFDGSYFRRTTAAQAAGLSCGVAMPIFVGDSLSAVVVFFCGDSDSDSAAPAGAIELWHNDPRVTGDMTLVDGYYGSTPGSLEAVSRDAYLPRGAGLPGMAWQSGSPVLMDRLDSSPRFLRGEAAAGSGINRGIAIPCPTRSSESCVLSFLSASATPVARRAESWRPDVAALTLQRVDGFCESPAGLAPGAEPIVLAGSTAVIARAFATGVPMVSESAWTEPGSLGRAAAAADLQSLIALPIAADSEVAEVLALYF